MMRQIGKTNLMNEIIKSKLEVDQELYLLRQKQIHGSPILARYSVEQFKADNKADRANIELVIEQHSDAIFAACKNLFSLCPEVERIHWAQLNPIDENFYVNDPYWLWVGEDEFTKYTYGYFDGTQVVCDCARENAEIAYNDYLDFEEDRLKYLEARFPKHEIQEAFEWEKNNPDVCINSYRFEVPSKILKILQTKSKSWWSDPTWAKSIVDRKIKINDAFGDRASVIDTETSKVIKLIEAVPHNIMKEIFSEPVGVAISRFGIEIETLDNEDY